MLESSAHLLVFPQPPRPMHTPPPFISRAINLVRESGYAPSQIFVHTYDKVIVTPLNKSSKNMVNSAETRFKSVKNDLFVLTHCEFLKCNFER